MGNDPFRASRRPARVRMVDVARRLRWRGLRGAARVSAAALVIGGLAMACAPAGSDLTAGPDSPAPAARGASEPGWRSESFRDLVVDVPAAWEPAPAPGGDWCAAVQGGRRAFPDRPYVDSRGPRRFEMMIACPHPGEGPDLHGGGVPREHWSPHVWFAPTPAAEGAEEVGDGRASAHGWTRLVRTVGSAKVFVLTDDAHLGEAERIIASARRAEVDHHGCAASSPIQAGGFVRPPAPFDVARLDAVDTVAVCHYELPGPGGGPGLLASRELGGTEATALLAAIRAAPAGGGPDTPDTCAKDRWGDTGIVLRLSAGGSVHEAYVYYDWCFNNGVDDGTTRRALTTASR
ncbi:hypothetical protein UG55_1001160 [Frankia sp. EI5c]|uniref:hypothetical protein n=1 Tax=Frankia sp. EI5c TaxID=683316 RepID=UPI0007C29F28|nr:hypothetical protein [Frankia sp. EI5c]OAA29655.1 hypothetical protein UG55_1001160 [Frankia sp. EI5c]